MLGEVSLLGIAKYTLVTFQDAGNSDISHSGINVEY
jgi:hypothetical protein